MTIVYLAYGSSGARTLMEHAEDGPVNLLVAVPSLGHFLKYRQQMNVGRWVLDSGAFSVQNSGKVLSYEEWRDAAAGSDADEVFALDVIFDPVATQRNCERAWADGIMAIPTYHRGSPLSCLEWCAANSDKIALGGGARLNHTKRLRWVSECMARVWPKKVHGFACASWECLRAAPFHSVDAASWTLAPSKMGAWAGYTGKQISLKARGIHDFWVEVEEHQRREKWASHRWMKELAGLR